MLHNNKTVADAQKRIARIIREQQVQQQQQTDFSAIEPQPDPAEQAKVPKLKSRNVALNASKSDNAIDVEQRKLMKPSPRTMLRNQ